MPFISMASQYLGDWEREAGKIIRAGALDPDSAGELNAEKESSRVTYKQKQMHATDRYFKGKWDLERAFRQYEVLFTIKYLQQCIINLNFGH